jgi:hypothetical protein
MWSNRMTRGGKLTIVNCLLWVIMCLGLAAGYPLLMLPALLTCWPLAWLSLVLMFGGATHQGLVIASVVIGVNSVLWGYGLSWLLSRVSPADKGPGQIPKVSTPLPGLVEGA